MGITSGRSEAGPQSEINVTPMVDIMLVLLIIFMVVTPFLRPGIPVQVPKEMINPDVDKKITNESSIVISIPNDLEYYLGKRRLHIGQLADEVRVQLEKNKIPDFENQLNEHQVPRIQVVSDVKK